MRFLFLIQKGMPVITKDGKYLGNLERVLGPETIILSGSRQPISEGWIIRILDREIYIAKTEAQVRKLWASGDQAFRLPVAAE